MDDPFTDELDPFEVTVTPSVVTKSADSWMMNATVENGTDADGGEIRLRVTDSARCAYGIQICVSEFERFLNSTLRPEFRLDAALAMGADGVFTIATTPGAGPRVTPPALTTGSDLAA